MKSISVCSISLMCLFFITSCGTSTLHPPTKFEHKTKQQETAPIVDASQAAPQQYEFDHNLNHTTPYLASLPYYCNPYKYWPILLSIAACKPFLEALGLKSGALLNANVAPSLSPITDVPQTAPQYYGFEQNPNHMAPYWASLPYLGSLGLKTFGGAYRSYGWPKAGYRIRRFFGSAGYHRDDDDDDDDSHDDGR